MAWEEAIQEEFQDCLKLFPELKNIGLEVRLSHCIGGAKEWSQDGQQKVVVLTPPLMCHQAKALRPVILFELSHFADPVHAEKIFAERADEKSKKLWQRLKEEDLLLWEINREKRGGE